MTRIIVKPIFQQPDGYWWAYSQIQPDRIYSLHTRDMRKAQAAYSEQLDRLRRYAGIDPADAGMDNPPEPMPQTTTDIAVEALHRRVEELEAENERLRAALRIVPGKVTVEDREWARDKIIDELEERVKELEAELGTLRATLKITDW